MSDDFKLVTKKKCKSKNEGNSDILTIIEENKNWKKYNTTTIIENNNNMFELLIKKSTDEDSKNILISLQESVKSQILDASYHFNFFSKESKIPRNNIYKKCSICQDCSIIHVKNIETYDSTKELYLCVIHCFTYNYKNIIEYLHPINDTTINKILEHCRKTQQLSKTTEMTSSSSKSVTKKAWADMSISPVPQLPINSVSSVVNNSPSHLIQNLDNTINNTRDDDSDRYKTPKPKKNISIPTPPPPPIRRRSTSPSIASHSNNEFYPHTMQRYFDYNNHYLNQARQLPPPPPLPYSLPPYRHPHPFPYNFYPNYQYNDPYYDYMHRNNYR